jgi:hypothetical protein
MRTLGLPRICAVAISYFDTDAAAIADQASHSEVAPMFALEVATAQAKATENPSHRLAPRPSTQVRSKPCDDRKHRVAPERATQEKPRRPARDFNSIVSLPSDEAHPSPGMSTQAPVGSPPLLR